MRVDELGRGVWAENFYILRTCPMCGENWSFRFMGTSGFWNCTYCDKCGIGLEDLKAHGVWVDETKIDAPDGLFLVSSHIRKEQGRVIPTGFSRLDRMIGGLEEGALTVVTGKRGDGKSTWCSQVALNAINAACPVCFYSGELSSDTFQAWVFQQAAGPFGIDAYTDQFGAVRHKAKKEAEEKIRKWLSSRLVMYDNSVVKSSERNAILERFLDARRHYDCRLFFIDNLMTAKYTESERDYYRQQSAFVGELTEFCLQNDVHVVLVAHPKKVAENSPMDENDQVAGIGDITNRASNVIRIERLTDKDRANMEKKGQPPSDSAVKVTKNRAYGMTGELPFDYEVPTRRFIQQGGSMITRFSWEDLT